MFFESFPLLQKKGKAQHAQKLGGKKQEGRRNGEKPFHIRAATEVQVKGSEIQIINKYSCGLT